MEGNCPGGSCPGGSYSGADVLGVKVRGEFYEGQLFGEQFSRGGIVIEPSRTSKTDLFEKIVNGFCNCSSTLLCFI